MNPTARDESILLSKVKVNTLFTQGSFVRLLFKLILLISFVFASISVEAMPVITNTATAKFTINGNNLNLSDSVQFTKDTVVLPTDTLTLEKRANVTSALIGNTILYTLTATNPNPRPLNNTFITDELPTGFIYQNNSAKINSIDVDPSNISVSGNTLNITLGTIPANTNLTITYEVNISASTPVGDAINKASASSDTATSPQTQANVVISEPVIVTPLVLTKIANVQEVNVGDIVRYTLTIQNDNDFVIDNAEVKDLLADDLEYIAGSATFNGTAITANIGAEINFNIGDVTANSTSTLIYDVKVNALLNDTRTLINTANITATDPQANSNTASASVNLVDDTLVITKTTTATNVLPGDVIDYRIIVTNPLARDLTNLTIKDILPTGFSYQTDSAMLNNIQLTNTDITVNANTIDYKIGTLAASTSLLLTYKANVTDNALPGNNVNTAQAMSDFAASLTTTATVKVRTPSTINFLKISNTGVSSIIQPISFNANQQGGEAFEEITDIILPNGTSVSLPIQQPIIASTQYTVNEPIVIEVIDLDQNIDPSQLDTIQITINIPETNDTEILLLTETSTDSGIFRGIVFTTGGNTTIQNGTLSVTAGATLNVNYSDEEDNTDVSVTAALIVPDTSLQIEKTAETDFAAVGELVRYSIVFRNTTGFDLTDVKINDVLPLGFRYVPNTTQLNGSSLDDSNVNFDGRSLTFNLNTMPTASVWIIEYVTKISVGTKIGDAVNTAYLSSGSLRSEDTQAIVKVQDDLMRSSNLLTGRVYIGCKTHSKNEKTKPRVLSEARIYMETGRSVLTDNEGFWHMEGVNPGAHVLQLDTDSIPGYEPLLCNDNTRRAQDSKSQFVNLATGNLWHVDFHVQAIEGYQATEKTSPNKNIVSDPTKLFNTKYLAEATEDFEILWPQNNFVPAVASTKIFIKHSPKHTVEIFLNKKKVSPLNYDGSDTNKERTVTIKRWLGVDIDIKNRNNTLLAILKDKSGKEIARKEHNIHFSGNPASAKLLKDQSILIADGKTTPVIALEVKDEDGFPMRANTHGYFTIENNQYSVKTPKNNDSEVSDLNQLSSGSYKYEIEENGIARIELNPTSQSGQIKLNLQFTDSKANKNDTEITTWLKPALREWILVGIAEGTLAHKKLSGNMQSLKDLGISDNFSERGRVAFFAKGQVKGKYLLTVAYDTHQNDREIGSQLNANIDPDAYYTIYGDNSNSQHEAPSSEKLYLKIEKDNFYALFGDYQTDMSVTELAKYQRTLNGIKTEYRGNRLSFKGFISETSNNHHHEEIPGDGTSGLYQLQNRIIPNSEKIVIETRDRFRSDKIVLRRELIRYQDYNINYNDGTLFFKFPITSRDRDLNPNVIVVDYDSEEDTNKAITAGGRVTIKSKNDKLETGLSLVNEGQNNRRDNQLIATDLTYKISPDTEIHVEIAQSKTEASNYEKRNAYIIELEKEIEKLEARLYHKKQESGFGIDSQTSENGIEKSGAELNYKINDKTRLNSTISTERNLENNNKRHQAQLEVVKQFNKYEVNAGLRHTQEKLDAENDPNNKIESNVFILGGQYTTQNDRVTLRTDLEKNISSDNGSEVSPDRLIVGADVKITNGFSLFAEHETTDNENIKTNNSRVGLSKKLWKGAKTRTTYTQERNDEGQRNYATLGLSQSVKVTDKISADFSIDKATTISDKPQQQFNQDSPVIQGTESDDYTAFSVGLGSSEKDWSWTSRAEFRNGDSTDKVNFLASVIRHYDNGKNLSARLSYYNSSDENGYYDQSTKLSFGSAWHPTEKDFVFFSRLDLINEDSETTNDNNIDAFDSVNNSDTQKIIHNMHYNRKINEKTQLGLHHGIKHVKDEDNGVERTATIDTGTISLRRDLNKRWDIGIHGGYLHDWDDKAVDYVAGVSIGLSPRKNMWVELGYNIEGFDDEDFDNNNFTSDGVYLGFRYKFNQDTLRGDLFNRRRLKK